VDGAPCTTPCFFPWVPGTTHQATAPGTVPVTTGTQYAFDSWTQGGPASQQVVAASTPGNYTAIYKTQYYLTTSAGPGGTIEPLSGWFYKDETVTVKATAGAGYAFSFLSGVPNGATNPYVLTMISPQTVT